MTDEEFLTAFEDCSLAEFHHIDHIRMAWLCLRRYGPEEGPRKIVNGIKKFAASKNSRLYHETITRFWIVLVQHAIDVSPQIDQFSELLTEFPYLQNSRSIFRHYAHQTLMSDHARSCWREPDLLALP